jgi:hypothetical protein
MVERGPPLAVNTSMAFIDDDEIEVTGRIVGVFIDQRLQRDNGYSLLVLEAAPDARHAIARQMRQALRESVLGLNGELIAVDDEQGARYPMRLEQAL